MKMTIIKTKTRITMKMLTDNLTPHRRISAEPGNPPKCGKNLFMQNKPNFQPNQLMLSAVIAGTYNEKPLVNPKITNPIKPKSNPIRTQKQTRFSTDSGINFI